MIILHDIQTKLAELKELVEQKAFHPYLMKHIQVPLIDEDRLLLLISIFDQLNLSDIEKNTYITATLLIQLALDTHDYVHSVSIDEELKGQQLTVLAGDYFSGLYYKHLANINNISLIRELSNGIKEINEHKIMLHGNPHTNNIELVLDHLKKIEGALFEKIADFFKVSFSSEFTLNLLLVKRLLREREQFLTTGTSIGFEAIKKMMVNDDPKSNAELTDDQQKKLLYAFDQAINRTIHSIKAGMKNLPYVNELFNMRIQSIVDEYQAMVKTFVEEG
ncbi:heptaprenyl diphosphate synthase component 1 [Neobacillus sp. LXY-4]|uniref:heptaprenyl diphosphate synthase component 1 n=1 Tax=Neobacillus sp. LXY-4 TaxID=3379826 RepID=UPI003EDFD7AA